MMKQENNNMDPVQKFNSYMTQHTDRLPLLSVQSTDDKRFTVLRELLSSVYEDVEDNAYSVGQHLSKLVDSLSTMEPNDKARIANTLRKYEVKGTHGGIRGKGTYGYDISRVDRTLIKRKRTN
jgi:ferritin